MYIFVDLTIFFLNSFEDSHEIIKNYAIIEKDEILTNAMGTGLIYRKYLLEHECNKSIRK